MPTIKNNYHEDSSHKATIENCNGSHEREDRTRAMFRVDFVKEKEQGKVYMTYEWYVKYITGSTRCKHFLDYDNTFDTIRHEPFIQYLSETGGYGKYIYIIRNLQRGHSLSANHERVVR